MLKVKSKKYFGARQLRPENLAELKQTLSSTSKEALASASKMKIEVEVTPDSSEGANLRPEGNPKPSAVIPGLGSDLITPADS